MDWYYAINGQQYGPIPDQEIERLAREGRLGRTDLVWNQGMGENWTQAGTVPSLLAVMAQGGDGAVPASQAAPGTLGTTPNAVLMQQARERLAGRWAVSVGACVLLMAISIGVNFLPYVGGVAAWIIAGPLEVGFAIFFLAIARARMAEIGQLFSGFSQFGSALAAYLLVALFVLLWSLLLIIPGMIAAYAYSQTYFILADHPGMGPIEAIDRSKEMMRGLKWKRFCLDWRFLGWVLLCMLTLGIGFLWLYPYMMASHARFYDDLAAPQAAGTDAT